MRASIARCAAAALVAVAAHVALTAAPASAATCSSAHGVSVVVDFHELGGGVRTACVADGGGDTAASLFPAAGFPLTPVRNQPGFVCKVSGKPADDPCTSTPPADAYWGLWWSDGESGSWAYSSTGASSLRIEDGGYVAFSWNGSSTRSAPGAAPAPHPEPSSTPSPGPSTQPGTHPHGAGGPATSGSGPSSTTSSAPVPSSPASASATPATGPRSGRHRAGKVDGGAGHRGPGKHGKPGKQGKHGKHGAAGERATGRPAATADATGPAASTDATVAVSSDPADPDGGLPGWVGPVVVVVLFGAAGSAAVARRRRGASRP